MEDQELEIDPVYKKGYWLQRGGSKDIDAVIEGTKNNDQYHSGLKGGKKEADREKFRECMEQMDKDKENDKDKGYEIG